jgi:hypothetical protein
VGFNWVDQDLNLSHHHQVLPILESYAAYFTFPFASIHQFLSMDDVLSDGHEHVKFNVFSAIFV